MRRCLVVLWLLMFFVPVCKAQELWDELGLDELSQAGARYDVGVELSPELELEQGVGNLLERAAEYLPAVLRAGLRSALMLLVIVILCAMAQGIQAAGGELKGPDVIVLAGRWP